MDDHAAMGKYSWPGGDGDGLSRHELRRWYRPLFRGVYSSKRGTPTLRDRTLGAWLTTDRAG